MINFIHIDPNGLCNAGCWFCPVSLVGNPKEHINQMPPELYENIIKQNLVEMIVQNLILEINQIK